MKTQWFNKIEGTVTPMSAFVNRSMTAMAILYTREQEKLQFKPTVTMSHKTEMKLASI